MDVAFVEPARQYDPAVHTPLHVDTFSPAVCPKYPGWQGPLHVAFVRLGTSPYWPGGHSGHDDEPDTLYCPLGQLAAVGDSEPATQ